MRQALTLVIGLAGGIAALSAVALAQAPVTESAPAAAQPSVPDPLEAGKQALNKGNYGTAQRFFAAYVKDNPNNADARYLAGNASLGLKQYANQLRRTNKSRAERGSRWRFLGQARLRRVFVQNLGQGVSEEAGIGVRKNQGWP
jgi:hypothetical protein